MFYCFYSVLRQCKNVELSFSDINCKTDLLKGTKKGTIYLTPYRVTQFCTIKMLRMLWWSPHFSYNFYCPPPHIHLLSWCSCPVTTRIAWARPCSLIIWWRAAASSSRCLEPTTLKATFRLRLVVGVRLPLLLADQKPLINWVNTVFEGRTGSLIETVYSGGWEGQANFKMSFPSGGAIEVGQHLFKLATNGLCWHVFS